MNESKQEPETSSEETSAKKVRESYTSSFKFELTSVCFQSKFSLKDISSEKLGIDFELRWTYLACQIRKAVSNIF